MPFTWHSTICWTSRYQDPYNSSKCSTSPNITSTANSSNPYAINPYFMPTNFNTICTHCLYLSSTSTALNFIHFSFVHFPLFTKILTSLFPLLHSKEGRLKINPLNFHYSQKYLYAMYPVDKLNFIHYGIRYKQYLLVVNTMCRKKLENSSGIARFSL